MPDIKKPLCPICGKGEVHWTVKSYRIWDTMTQSWVEDDRDAYTFCDSCGQKVQHLVDADDNEFEIVP
jgi:hypothetical protein